jgi:hypothetical protein
VLSPCSLSDACCLHTSAAVSRAWIQGEAVCEDHSFLGMGLVLLDLWCA